MSIHILIKENIYFGDQSLNSYLWCDCNTHLDFNRASSLKQHAVCGRQGAPIRHINLISSQTVFALTY